MSDAPVSRQPITDAQFERIVKRLTMYGDNKIEMVVALRIQRQAIEECETEIRRLSRPRD